MRSKATGYLIVGFLLSAGLLGSGPAAADSAIAFTDDAQTYGYCYDTADANLCAEKYCFEGSKGAPCQTRFRSAARGYFSLALGDRGWGVGYSTSNSNLAGESAMAQCWQQTQGCRVVETWQAKGKNE
ncbi:MAG TPA: hypothetical protein VJL84_04545 [Kiloniellales bacterium]|nr:hypothetical protein [Kiloniellales bacterium]